jgi:hypothetical protein
MEAEGMTRSDAQGVVDAEDLQSPCDREFPQWEFHEGFRDEVMPLLADWSWRNDTMPCFLDEDTGLIIWANHLDESKRDYPSDMSVYTAELALKGDDGEWEHGHGQQPVMETDSLEEIKDFILQRRLMW